MPAVTRLAKATSVTSDSAGRRPKSAASRSGAGRQAVQRDAGADQVAPRARGGAASRRCWRRGSSAGRAARPSRPCRGSGRTRRAGRSVVSVSGSSAQARWVTRRRREMPSAAAAWRRRGVPVGLGRTPTRPIPVSALRWTGTRCAARAAGRVGRGNEGLAVDGWRSGRRRAASGSAATGGSAAPGRARRCPPRAAATPSSTSATAEPAAPPSRAARATSTAPWP